MKAAMIIVLACCFLLADDLVMARRPSSTFSLEFRVTDPELRSRSDVTVIVRIGMHGMRRLPTGEWILAGTTQYLGLWREVFMDLVFKKLHMA
jgi:hypothetical protein